MGRIVSALLPFALLLAVMGAIGIAGIGAVRITGDSMRPAMRVGDVAIYRRGQAGRDG